MKQIIKEISLAISSSKSDELALKLPNWQRRMVDKHLSSYTLIRLINYLLSNEDEHFDDNDSCFVSMESSDIDLDKLLADYKKLEECSNTQKQQIDDLQSQLSNQKSRYIRIIMLLILLLIVAIVCTSLAWI